MAIRNPRWVIQTVFASTWLSLLSLLLQLVPMSVHAQAAAAAPPPSATAGAAPAAAPAPGDEEKARAHFRLGRAHYDNGDFAQAAVEFEEAYRISQRSALLYNIYLAYRDANDTRHAATALRNYLTLEKEVENRGQLESRLAALERSLADGTAPQPAAQATAQPTQPTGTDATAAQPTEAQAAPSAATEAPPESKPNMLVPIVLMGAGGAMIVGSLITGAMASGKQSDLEKACPDKSACDPKYQSLADSGKSLALVSTVLTVGGIVTAGVGAVLFVINLGKGAKATESAPAAPTATASLMCLPGACGASLHGTF